MNKFAFAGAALLLGAVAKDAKAPATLTPKLMLQVTGTTRIMGPTPDFTIAVALPYYF